MKKEKSSKFVNENLKEGEKLQLEVSFGKKYRMKNRIGCCISLILIAIVDSVKYGSFDNREFLDLDLLFLFIGLIGAKLLWFILITGPLKCVYSWTARCFLTDKRLVVKKLEGFRTVYYSVPMENIDSYSTEKVKGLLSILNLEGNILNVLTKTSEIQFRLIDNYDEFITALSAQIKEAKKADAEKKAEMKSNIIK